MENLREKLVELKVLLEVQNNSISNFIEKLITKLDNNDYTVIDEIINASKIQDFMNYKAAYLFNGKGYANLDEINTDWKLWKSQYKNEIIPYEKVKQTLWYKENQRWAKWIKEQGYDIYDLGDNPGQFINSFDRVNAPDASTFYDMEKVEIFNSK